MTVSLPATLPAQQTTPAGAQHAAEAPVATDAPSFAQAMQTRLNDDRPATAGTVRKGAPIDGARKPGHEATDVLAEDTASPVGTDLAAQALMLAEQTLVHRQPAGAARTADAANAPAGQAVMVASGDLPALVEAPPALTQRDADGAADWLVADGAALASGDQPEAGAEIDEAGRLPLAGLAALAGEMNRSAIKPAGAALVKPEIKAVSEAVRLAPGEARDRTATLPQALAESASGRTLPASLTETNNLNTATEPAAARESLARAPEHLPMFQQILRDAAADATPRATLPVPVHHAQWGQALSEQVVSWTKDMRSSELKAELRLDPPDLGPLRIALTIADGLTSASFTSAHASVRQALEQALPQLQAALAEAGLALGNAQVGDQDRSDADQQAAASGQAKASAQGADAATGAADQPAAQRNVSATGLIDVFA